MHCTKDWKLSVARNSIDHIQSLKKNDCKKLPEIHPEICKLWFWSYYFRAMCLSKSSFTVLCVLLTTVSRISVLNYSFHFSLVNVLTFHFSQVNDLLMSIKRKNVTVWRIFELQSTSNTIWCVNQDFVIMKSTWIWVFCLTSILDFVCTSKKTAAKRYIFAIFEVSFFFLFNNTSLWLSLGGHV